jgi:hypothetical protein
MKCSICHQEGHNSRTCPKKDETFLSSSKNFSFWNKVDGISEQQAQELATANMSLKSEIAPNGRGTFVIAETKKLPEKIKKVLAIKEHDAKKTD